MPEDAQDKTPPTLDYAAPPKPSVVFKTGSLILSAVLLMMGFPMGLVGFISFRFGTNFSDSNTGFCFAVVGGTLFAAGIWVRTEVRPN